MGRFIARTPPVTAGSGLVRHPAQCAALEALLDVPGLTSLSAQELADALTVRFASDTVAAWVERLAAAGFGASPYVHDLAALMRDPRVVAHTGPAPRLSGTPLVAGRPTPVVGADTREVLASIGVDIDAEPIRRASRLVAGWPTPGDGRVRPAAWSAYNAGARRVASTRTSEVLQRGT